VLDIFEILNDKSSLLTNLALKHRRCEKEQAELPNSSQEMPRNCPIKPKVSVQLGEIVGND
jgi:hypothetical protein